MDLVSITLCMCIGNAVAWLMAIHTGSGLRVGKGRLVGGWLAPRATGAAWFMAI